MTACGSSKTAVPNESTVPGDSSVSPVAVTTTLTGAVDPAATAPPATLAGPSTQSPIYGYIGASSMSPNVANARALVYVPSNDSGKVTVIDQATMQVIDSYEVGKIAQHVVPGWDLTTLYAAASGYNQLVPIDPTTGKPGPPIKVDAPYNLYFTPDGASAIVMAERRNRIDYYDRTTWKLQHSTPTGKCKGVNHADWSPDLSWFLATCEFSGDILKVETITGNILSSLALPKGAMPQDLRIAPDGTKFYVADMAHGGVYVISADGTAVIGKIETGKGAHGIYPSRDATKMYVTNRGRLEGDTKRKSRDGEGSISVVDPTTDTVIDTWSIPGGGSPDMGGVSADGSMFWVSGRYDDVVYAFDTTTGELKAKIKVPDGPHGLCVFPQPGRYSLGHTGNFR